MIKKIIFLFCVLFLATPSYAEITERRPDKAEYFKTLKPDLEVLTIMGNKLKFGIYASEITSIHPDIKNMTNLKRLNIGIHYLSDIEKFDLPMEIFKLPKLEELTLTHQVDYKIVGAKDNFQVGKHLKSLMLVDFEQDVTDLLKHFHNLTVFTLYRSSFNTLPEEIYNFKQLKILRIIGNMDNITINEKICNLNNLEELIFTGSEVNLPDCINKLDKVKKISLLYNGKKIKP